MEGGAYISQRADGDLFTEVYSLNAIRASVYAGDVGAKGDVGCKFVQFTSNRERRPLVGDKREAIGARHDRIGDDKIFVEERFENGGTRA